jgi:hypothetical protein
MGTGSARPQPRMPAGGPTPETPTSGMPPMEGEDGVEDGAGTDSTGGMEVVEAEIRVGGRAVRYLRAGRGSPVLLLGEGGSDAPPGAVFQALAREHRVFRPLGPIPRSRDEVEGWLRGLVEGLGLRTPQVVAGGELAPLLARLVCRNGGFVGRVVFLPPGGEADGWRGPL